MSNFFKIRLLIAVRNLLGDIRLVMKELYVTAVVFSMPEIWESIIDLSIGERYKIVSFRFLASFEVQEGKYHSPIGLDKYYYFEDELFNCSYKVINQEVLHDVRDNITNHYHLRITFLYENHCSELEIDEQTFLINSTDLLFNYYDEEGFVLRIIAIKVLKQYYIDTRNISPEFCTTDEESWDDFLLALEKDNLPKEGDKWEECINNELSPDSWHKWYNPSSAPILKTFMEPEEIELLERELTLNSLIN